MIVIARARRAALFSIVTLGMVALLAGFLAREPVERWLFVRAADRATGLDVSIGRLDRDGATYVLHGVRASVPGGTASLVATQASVVVRDGTIAIHVNSPQVRFDPDRYRDADRARAHDALAAFHGGNATISVDVGDGRLTIANGANAILSFEGITGRALATSMHVTYDIAAQFIDGTNRYPIVGQAQRRRDGTIVQRWTARAIPLAPFDGLEATDGALHARAGELRDVTIDDAASLHVSARVVGGKFSLGTHELASVHGSLVVDGGAIGSRRLIGTFDRMPFDAAGEVHDLGAHYRWLRDGSHDLASLARLAAQMASEPHVGAMHLEATAPGLAYGQYAMLGDHGPLAITLLGIDPREPTLHFGTALAGNHIVSGGERTSAMGVRTHAVAGVNGDYFDIGRTYQPQGMLVKDGALVRGPTDRAAIAIDGAKHVTFAEFHLHGTVRTARGLMKITEINDWPSGDVAIMTPDFAKELSARPEMRFVRLAPLGRGTTRYRVTSVETATHALPIGFGISLGPLVKTPAPRVGETIEVSYATEPSLAHATAAIGGGPLLLRNGEPYEDPHAPAPDEHDYRWPVVALARERDDRLLFVAVDGRHPERSVGMTRPEFTELLERLGSTDAMALDSGGSVTLVSRAPGDANVSVRNVPSDNSAERWISDALFLYSDAPGPTIVPPAVAATPIAETRPAP